MLLMEVILSPLACSLTSTLAQSLLLSLPGPECCPLVQPVSWKNQQAAPSSGLFLVHPGRSGSLLIPGSAYILPGTSRRPLTACILAPVCSPVKPASWSSLQPDPGCFRVPVLRVEASPWSTLPSGPVSCSSSSLLPGTASSLVHF